MKKIITLLFAACIVAGVNAQSSKEEARRVILGGGNNDGNTSTRGRDVILGGGNNNDSRTYPNSYPENNSRQARIDQINREYESKIYSIRTNNTLSSQEKERMINQLEKDRAKKIKQVNGGSYDKNYRKDKKHDHDRYEGKHDNGKHKGWTKGKGNQKKNKHGYDD